MLLSIVTIVVTQALPLPVVRDVTAPLARAVGLQQRWAMFSRPPHESVTLSARVELADGGVEEWRPPGSRTFPAGAGQERWRAWWESVAVSADRERHVEGLARWLAARARSAGHEPVRVLVIERRRSTPAAGEAVGGRTVSRRYTIEVGRDGNHGG